MRKSKLFALFSIVFGIVIILIVYFCLAATGVIRSTQRDIVIKSLAASKDYDGTSLVYESYEDVSNLYDGDRVQLFFTGSQTDAGKSENTFIAKVYDSLDNDVTDSYNITYVYGILEVKQRKINVLVKNTTKDYDGKPLSVDKTYEITGSNYSKDDILSISGSSILSGDTLYVYEKGEVSSAGVEEEIIFNYNVKNSGGNDITNNYDVTFVNESNKKPYLKINQIDLTIETSSTEKIYDGEKLCYENDSKEGYNITNGELDDGDTLSIEYLNSIIDVGSISNDAIIKVFDSDGNDVTEKYNITKKCGTLTVKKYTIYYSYDKVIDYTGNEYELDFSDVVFSGLDLTNYSVKGNISYDDTSETVLPGNHKVNLSITEFKKKVTTYDDEGNEVEDYKDELNNFDFVFKSNSENDLNYCYLCINPKEVNITIDSFNQITYDGLSHEDLVTEKLNANTESLVNNLIDNDTATITFTENGVTPDYTNAGTHIYTPYITVKDKDGNDTTQLYDFNIYLSSGSKVDGVYLIINKFNLTLASKSSSKEYVENEPLTCKEFNTILLPTGLSNLNVYTNQSNVPSSVSEYILLNASNFSSLSNVGEIDNKFILYDILHYYLNDNGESVSESIIDNFYLNYQYGTLTVSEKADIILYPTLYLYYSKDSYTNDDIEKIDCVLNISSDNKSVYTVYNSKITAYATLANDTDIANGVTKVGQYEIKISSYSDLYIYKSSDEDKTNIASSLTVSFITGKLYIIYDYVTVTDSYSETITYDGSSHKYYDGTKSDYINSYITLSHVNSSIDLSNFTFEYEFSDEIYSSGFMSLTNASTYVNKLTVKIKDSSGEDVTRYFMLKYNYGQLTINSKYIASLSSVSSSKSSTYEQIVYNGIIYGASNSYSISDLESILAELCGDGYKVSITFDTTIAENINYFYVTVLDSSNEESNNFSFECSYGALT